MKKCKRCGLEKLEHMFPRNKKMSDGLHYYCKTCVNEASRKTYKQAAELRSTFSDFDTRIRRCTTCQQEKTNKEFKIKQAGLSSMCKDCDNLRSRAGKYSLTVESLSQLLAKGCEACGSFVNLAIDHDHNCCPTTTGGKTSCGNCVRGVLCQNCNIAEGCIYSREQLNGLVAYMNKHNVI